MNLIGIIVGIFLYTYLFLGTNKSYIGTLGSITLAICLINYNEFSHVFIRPTNVVIGILVGTFTLRFFFPRRATKMLLLEIQTFLAEYASISNYLAQMNDSTTDVRERLIQLESNVIARVPRFQTLLTEAEIEISKDSHFTKVSADMLQPLRHIFRYYASILASILYENIKISETDKKSLIFLGQVIHQLKENLSQLKSENELIVIPDFLQPKDDKRILSSMLHLIVLECGSLEMMINTLIDTVKTVKLE